MYLDIDDIQIHPFLSYLRLTFVCHSIEILLHKTFTRPYDIDLDITSEGYSSGSFSPPFEIYKQTNTVRKGMVQSLVYHDLLMTDFQACLF